MPTASSLFVAARAAVAALLIAAIAAGCTSTPQASADRDTEAKQFITHPATAAIYIYRHAVNFDSDDSVLYVNHRLIGSTLAGAYFRVDVQPGQQLVHGIGYDQGRIEFEARPGEIYFVSLSVAGGISRFELKDGKTGRSELLACCALMENWAPGQRPLLR